MENLFDKLPEAKDLLVKRNANKQSQMTEQSELIMKEIGTLTSEDSLVLNFPIISELRSMLYKKGYTVRVHGNESTITIRDPKEDMKDEWASYDCGN
ncbi:hypothetical protein KPL39_04195 [Clostridium gasigenes]|uniref:hypothetical protein n=1 Tax=Clostridium gasigenes TaxID=94869 RepID=UPI001C0E5D72|nr:hypothetical protein [Clostridium gasigenes]MBU3135465.1 hypothetical protein [Clostridium gasigenes]